MYSEEQIKEIVKENNFLTKVCHSWEDSCLILVPNFKEYNFLFGGGRTPTCYAMKERYWDEYHGGIVKEIDFLSTSIEITKKYQYITFCFYVDEIDWSKYNKGGYGVIFGRIIIHDLSHEDYSFSFKALFNKDGGVCFVDVYLNIGFHEECFNRHIKFVNFCRDFGKRKTYGYCY